MGILWLRYSTPNIASKDHQSTWYGGICCFGTTVPHFWPFDALKTPPVPRSTTTQGTMFPGSHAIQIFNAEHCLERPFHSLVTVEFVVLGELVPHFWLFDALKAPFVHRLTPTQGTILHGCHMVEVKWDLYCLKGPFTPLKQCNLQFLWAKCSILAVCAAYSLLQPQQPQYKGTVTHPIIVGKYSEHHIVYRTHLQQAN